MAMNFGTYMGPNNNDTGLPFNFNNQNTTRTRM